MSPLLLIGRRALICKMIAGNLTRWPFGYPVTVSSDTYSVRIRRKADCPCSLVTAGGQNSVSRRELAV